MRGALRQIPRIACNTASAMGNARSRYIAAIEEQLAIRTTVSDAQELESEESGDL
jgi:hypothetical protein